ncbi:TlpA disulfide reductase family protein [Marinomonas sp. S3726]|uniref:TlpA disulfide reductase family protein n=1 Tax=Marinomonas sp. S3726 TaxID=579484 RepID=UPI000698F55D|nr:TlpA disulfide reductase family protein [Marinomonas sp. S3726]
MILTAKIHNLFNQVLPTSLLAFLLMHATPSQADVFAAADAPMAPKAEVSLPLVTDAKLTEKSMRLADYKGKTLLVDFWASWCGPCRASFPWMNEMQAKYQDQGFEVVAINLDLRPELALGFLTKIPANFPVLLDEDAQLPDAFNVIGMPTSYLIDKEGRLRAQHVGFQEARVAEYEAAIQMLLAE